MQEMAFFFKRFLVGLGHFPKLVELMIFFMRMKWLRSFLFCYKQFRLQSMAIHCNRRGVYTETPHTSFLLLHSAHTGWCTLTSWLKNVFVRITPCSWSSMLCGWAFVLWLSVPRFVPFRVSLLSFALFFPLLLVLCPEPLPPCGQRQGN